MFTRVTRGRIAASALFFTNGAIYANLLPRLPQLKDAFEMTNAFYGLALIALPIGGVVAGPLPAPILRRFGTGRTAAVGSVLIAGAVYLAGSVPHISVFLLGLFLAGALDAVVDTAQNAQGLRVQRLGGTSIINSMHALWSVGAVIGGLMGTAAAALHIPLAVHLAVSGLLFAALALLCQRWTVPDTGPLTGSPPPDNDAAHSPTSAAEGEHAAGGEHAARGEHAASAAELEVPVTTGGLPKLPPGSGWALRALLPIAAVAMAGVLVEDIGNNWAAVYLRDVLGAPISLAGLGYVSLVGAQFVGRLVGDVMINALGETQMTRVGGVFIAVGLGLVVLAPTPWVVLVGFALAGFGCATLVPTAYAAADRAPGLRPGTGLTLVSWCMRIVFVASPPLVGLAADAVGLRVALCVFPLLGVAAFIFAGALRPKRRG